MLHRTARSFDPGRIRIAGAVILFIALQPFPSRAAGENLRFTRFNQEEGLSQSAVRDVAQDETGFIWFGTEDGLNRYDGFTFRIYRQNRDDPDSLSSGNINSLWAGRGGRLWIGTQGGGVNRYDLWTDKFTRYLSRPDDPASLSSDDVTAVMGDSAGRIWVGTQEGLNRLDPETGRCVRYRSEPGNPGSLSDNFITALAEDRRGRLWIGTRNGGVNAFDPETGRFLRVPVLSGGSSYGSIVTLDAGLDGNIWAGTAGGILLIDATHETARPYPPSPLPFTPAASGTAGWRISEDSRGVLWIGTLGDGLYRYDPKTGGFSRFRTDPLSPASIGNNFVYRAFEDSGGVLWIGTENGLNKTDLNAKKFRHYVSIASDSSTLSDNYVKAFTEDARGTIWVGTLQGGLNAFSPKEETFIRFRHVPGVPGTLSGNRITALHAGPTGTVWIGIYGTGVDRYDSGTGTFRRAKIDSLPTSGINDPRVMAVMEDRAGIVWVGTQTGLHRYNPRTGTSDVFRARPEDPSGLSHDYIYAIFEDREGRLWIGTGGGGLNRFVPENGTFVRYQYRDEDPASLSDNFISCFHQDTEGILWIGTAGGGFNRFDPRTGEIRRYADRDGLPNNAVYGISGDAEGKLWISTNKGLSRFDPKTGSFRNYDVSDGLQSNEFNGAAAFLSRDGDMYFGGINGFNRFRPEDIVDSSFSPPVVLTDFQILSRSLFAGGGGDRNPAMRAALAESRPLALTYRDRVIDLEFAALHFASPGKIRYRYKMDGFDPTWSPPGTRRLATYTNLPGGQYTFRVQATNNDGLWSGRELALILRVSPPYWKTWWFQGLALAASLFLVFTYVRIHTDRIRKRNIVLERHVEERTEKLKAANVDLEREIGERTRAQTELQASLREKEILLREIHHRVKNNMQVVSSFLSIQARSVQDNRVRDIFKKTQDRVRMMALIHENLYKSKDLSGIDAKAFLRETVDHLSSYIVDPDKTALRSNIGDVTLDIEAAIPCGLIVNELVTNALKYAFPPDVFVEREESFKGEIAVGLHPAGDGGFVLSVRDNGIGIPEGLDAGKAGSLGLQLVRGLVSQIHGSLKVERAAGTSFTILFGCKEKPGAQAAE